ncbi:MAG: hypothetical protein ABSG68_18435 [Thermoguttaceae bacterium]
MLIFLSVIFLSPLSASLHAAANQSEEQGMSAQSRPHPRRPSGNLKSEI